MKDLTAAVAAVVAAEDAVTSCTQELKNAERRLKRAREDLRQTYAEAQRGPTLFDAPAPPAPLPAVHPGRQDVVREQLQAAGEQVLAPVAQVTPQSDPVIGIPATGQTSRNSDLVVLDMADATTPEQSIQPVITAWAAVAAECPRKIDRFLHQAGRYIHGMSEGKLVCVGPNQEIPRDWEPTTAQNTAFLASLGQPPAQESAVEPPAQEFSWDHACTFVVHLADGQRVACTWDPSELCVSGDEPGFLVLRGACLNPSAYLKRPVAVAFRDAPPQVLAARWAQEAADAHARKCAEPEVKVKEPRRRKRAKKAEVVESVAEKEVEA
jgi:hypothetical protein